MIRVGIVGSTGYVAGELLRLLVHHPKVNIEFLYSHSQAGARVNEVHQDIFTEMVNFSTDYNPRVDLIFLCTGHGQSRAFLEANPAGLHTKIIDLSADFRLLENDKYREESFVYGLTELNREAIAAARYIANPGCFATAIQLALLPLLPHCIVSTDIHLHGLTGSSGAGQSFFETSHFSWRANNISAYKPFRHQHVPEVRDSFLRQGNSNFILNFIPVRGDFTRGIFLTAYFHTELELKEIKKYYTDFYRRSPFVHLQERNPHLKQVVNTNNAVLQLEKIDDKLLITVVIDNLLKGAAGQAVQNMNVLFGLPEQTGLQLKASYF